MSQQSLQGHHSHWWSSLSDGDFDSDPLAPTWPHPGQVVAHYRELAGLARREVSFRLNVGPKEQYYLEAQCRGLDDIARRRVLCKLLSIPPELLGLAAASASAGGVGWWVREYEPWPSEASDSADWPNPGAVTKFYRKAKGWTQPQLAEALGVSEGSVRNMENQNIGLGSVSRRRALSFLLVISPLLLGLDAEHDMQSLDMPAVRSASMAPATELIDAYRSAATALLSGYIVGHQQDNVQGTLTWLSHAREVSSMLRGSQRSQMFEVQSLGYQGLVTVTKAYAPDSQVLCYANQSVSAARSANNSDVLAIALQRRAEMLLDRGYIELAQRSAQEAMMQDVSNYALLVSRAAACARIMAATATDVEGRKTVLAMLEKSAPVTTGDDPFSLHHDKEILTVRCSQTFNLLAANAPQSEARNAYSKSRNLLEQLAPSSARRRILARLELAKAFLGLGEYEYAATMAVEALPLMDQLKSILYLAPLNELYMKLRGTTLRNDPRVARLGLYLYEHPVL